MKASADEFRDAVEGFAGTKKGIWRKPSEKFVTWLADKRIPRWLQHQLVSGALAKTTHVGVAYFYQPSRILKDTSKYPEMLRHGFLQIGSAFDGDPLVVQFRGDRGATGYLSHEALWCDADEREVLFLKVASTIGEYAGMASKIKGCPIDFHGVRAG
jgi:hypothetical protein